MPLAKTSNIMKINSFVASHLEPKLANYDVINRSIKISEIE